MNKKITQLVIYKFIFTLIISIGYSQNLVGDKQTKSILILGAKAHLGNGAIIEQSAIGFKDGVITLVTSAKKANRSEFDIVINADDQHIYPGFIAPNSTLGLVEIDAVKASDDESEIGIFNPHIRSIIAYDAQSAVTETVRPNGILIAQITPRGRRLTGNSSIVQLDAWNWEDAIIKKDGGLHLYWPKTFHYTGWWAEKGSIIPNKNYQKQIDELTHFFDKSKGYFEQISYQTKDKKDLLYHSMSDLFNHKQTLFIHANDEKQLRDAIYFAELYNLKQLVIVGGYQALDVSELLKKKNIPVLLRRVHDLPTNEDEPLHKPYQLASQLIKKGILVGLQNAGDMERMQTRNLPFYAGTCASWGMDKEQALKLITLNNAKILGIDKQYGSLEEGKSATLFISKGDALDMRTNQLIKAYIDGRQINLLTRQQKLYQTYKKKYNTNTK